MLAQIQSYRQSERITKRPLHKASASQNERVTKRACADARSLPCRGTTRCKRGELFVTADLLRRDVPRVTRRSAPSFSRLWTTCNNRKATASTDDQRDDASAERPASSMQVRKNLEPTCHVTSGVLSDTTSVRNTQYHKCCTPAAGRRCPAYTQCTLT